MVSVAGADNYPVTGGLMSYAADFIAMWRRGGYYVDRVLKGANPADLAVELPATLRAEQRAHEERRGAGNEQWLALFGPGRTLHTRPGARR
jgi:hypothetical protein